MTNFCSSCNINCSQKYDINFKLILLELYLMYSKKERVQDLLIFRSFPDTTDSFWNITDIMCQKIWGRPKQYEPILGKVFIRRNYLQCMKDLSTIDYFNSQIQWCLHWVCDLCHQQFMSGVDCYKLCHLSFTCTNLMEWEKL